MGLTLKSRMIIMERREGVTKDDGPYLDVPFPACYVCGRQVRSLRVERDETEARIIAECHGRRQTVRIPRGEFEQMRLSGARVSVTVAFKPGEEDEPIAAGGAAGDTTVYDHHMSMRPAAGEARLLGEGDPDE